MGTTFRYIADPAEPSKVIDWFRSLPTPPQEAVTERSTVLYFREMGQLAYDSAGKVDGRKSPVATVYHPTVRRGILWTVGEVHFLATPLKQSFPALHKMSLAFARWLSAHECVFSNKRGENEFAYYLEGSIQHCDPPVYAFESGLLALRAERYFVGESDNEHRLDTLCKTLKLRGVDCASA